LGQEAAVRTVEEEIKNPNYTQSERRHDYQILAGRRIGKAPMQTYMDDLLQVPRDQFPGYFDGNNYMQRNSGVADNLTSWSLGYRPWR
jgi:hypothetical protein